MKKERFKVVMLPAKDWNVFIAGEYNLHIDPKGILRYDKSVYPTSDKPVKQHLYILSNDEIKEGDLFVDLIYNLVHQAGQNASILNHIKDKVKKIVATNDPSLGIQQKLELSDAIRSVFKPRFKSLPLIDEPFILAYIKAYNEGNKIEEVSLEFESILCGKCATRENQCTCVPTIKLRPDNTVIISFTKKTYSREEVIKLIYNLLDIDNFVIEKCNLSNLDTWMSKNL